MVRAVPDRDPRRLAELEAIGLVPGAVAVVQGESREPPGVLVRMAEGDQEHAITRRVASKVLVAEA